MITAVDTNVLLDVLIPNEQFFEAAVEWIERSADEGSLVICGLVYAELCIHFGARRECNGFLDANAVRVEQLDHDAHFLASRVWRTYRERGGKRTRILADFLIGAHAQVQATRLLSRDRGFYRELFPELQLLDPSSSAD